MNITYFNTFIHNVVIHPLMEFLPFKYGYNLHEINANYIFGNSRYDEIALEYKSWLNENKGNLKTNYKIFIHNVIIYPLMMYIPASKAKHYTMRMQFGLLT